MDYIAIFIAGYLLCFFTAGKRPERPRKPETADNEILVKRNRLGLRNPLKTNVTAYDRYKTSEGLYAPAKPKAKPSDDVEVGR